MPEKILLKRYANRRLYDTHQSAYVTLEEVAQVIKAGLEIEVREAKTGDDVTEYILTQIVLEAVKNRNGCLPAPVLHLIIRYGDGILAEFFQNYLQEAIKGFLAYRSLADEQFKKWLGLGVTISETTPGDQFNLLTPLVEFLNPVRSEKETEPE
ncbi:MAG: transcriptional regulator [Proteobacteria bacterium]|nr:transcriptional regulator [Pseudomonadota bacterium]MBU1742503.1 transcriptional regulator [Pseudomonadota bacterium]